MLILNGEPHPLPQPPTLATLINTLQQNHGLGRVAVEVNGRLIPRPAWPDHVLQAQDQIEVVKAIGGG